MTTPTAQELLMQVGDEARKLRQRDPYRALAVSEVDDLLRGLAQRLANALAEVERLRLREAYAAGLSLALKVVLDAAGVPEIPSPELDTRVKVLVEQRDEARANLAEARRVQAECREKIHLALCDENADYNEWCGEVLPLIHDALLGLDAEGAK